MAGDHTQPNQSMTKTRHAPSPLLLVIPQHTVLQ